ncbi:hypothetical protein D3C78_811150 [compost metagenome]
MGALLEAFVHLMVGLQHRVAGFFHQAFFEGVVGDRIVDQRLDDVLDLLDGFAGDGLIDLLQILEDALVLFIDDVDAGFVVGSPADGERHGSSPLIRRGGWCTPLLFGTGSKSNATLFPWFYRSKLCRTLVSRGLEAGLPANQRAAPARAAPKKCGPSILLSARVPGCEVSVGEGSLRRSRCCERFAPIRPCGCWSAARGSSVRDGGCSSAGSPARCHPWTGK